MAKQQLKPRKLPPFKSLIPDEIEAVLHFPVGGLHVSAPVEQQPNVPVSQTDKTDYGRTCAVGVNVRSYEAQTGRRRGASRPGLSRWLQGNTAVPGATQEPGKQLQVGIQPKARHFSGLVYTGHRSSGLRPVAQIVQPGGKTRVTILRDIDFGPGFVQNLAVMVSTGYTQPGGHVQLSLSGRVVTLVVVSAGQVVVSSAGDDAYSTTINNTAFDPPLNAQGVVYSAANNQKLYFADGYNWVVYSPSLNTLETWVASAGVLPTDSHGNAPRLICTWRGRTVLSGLLYDPQIIYFSKVSDPTNWDYLPASPSALDAFALTVGQLGFVGDVVTALIPYTDDVMLVGGDHEIHLMSGDPEAGGQLDLVSDAIGISWGAAWCKDPIGVVYFMSNRMGIYTLTPGQAPQRISQAIEPILQQINSGDNTFSMVYDDRYQGLHLFVTPTIAPGATRHFFFEVRTNSWFTDEFADPMHNPLCCVTYDGNEPGDRVALIGSWDGYVRFFDLDADTDDGMALVSTVVIGPLNTPSYGELLLKDMQAVLAEDSGDVTYEVLVGSSAEAALASDPVETGTWSAGRNLTTRVRAAGHAIYLRLTSTSRWAMEGIRVRLEDQGKVRQRGA